MPAQRFNPNHAPAGAGGGQFTSAGSGGGKAPAKGGPKEPQAAKQHAGHEAHLAHMRHLADNPIREGASGPQVRSLQERLNQLGFHLAADGEFGPKTLAAVRAFQRARKDASGRALKQDGIVGPLTAAALELKPPAAHHAAHHAKAHPAQAVKRALAHEPIGKPGGPGVYGMKGKQYPAYFQHVRNDLIQSGHTVAEAHQLAWGILRNFAEGHDGHGNKVHADTQAKAVAALAEMKKLQAEAHAGNGQGASRAMTMAAGQGCDGDGLDASWDDCSGLPDMTGLGVADFEAADAPDGSASRAARPGGGARFRALEAALAAKGAADPGALAAHIGRRKYGKARFTALAAKARRHKGGGGMSRSELFRYYPLEDIRIVSRAEGDGSGTLVEAYATVFDETAEIRDHEGHYMEVIDRSAFDDVLGRISRSRGGFAAAVKVLYNHGKTMEGQPAPEYQVPIGVPVDIRPERRGLLTRTQYDASDPFAERILSKVKSGAITAQSFVGGIVRSAPELRGPGDRHRARNGALTTVRRMQLGLREYGPVLFPAYTGAEILGVRMSIPGSPDEGPDFAEDEEYAPATEGDGTGGAPADATSARHHQHALYALRSREAREREGLVF
jgi:HK97 family phage prohead protease